VRLVSRNRNDLAARFSILTRALANLPDERTQVFAVRYVAAHHQLVYVARARKGFKPRLVAEIDYAEWTDGNYLGIRNLWRFMTTKMSKTNIADLYWVLVKLRSAK
jgi:hypothetical protein